jgi:hypothetical protein
MSEVSHFEADRQIGFGGHQPALEPFQPALVDADEFVFAARGFLVHCVFHGSDWVAI